MNTSTPLSQSGFNKLHVEEVVRFANINIPNVDKPTLNKFLDLVKADKSNTTQSPQQLLAKMQLTLKYIPGACAHSLMILVDLLEIPLSNPTLALNPPNTDLIIENPKLKQKHSFNFFDNAIKF